MFDQKDLQRVISYDPNTGLVIWLEPSKYKPELKGKVAGSFSKQSGYFNIKLQNKSYRLHRVIWFYVYGEWPDIIDHIDRDRGNNKLSNLRSVDNRGNAHNKALVNKSGIIGVYPNGLNGWMAQTTKNGEYKYLGTYKTKEQAKKAYDEYISL